MKKILWIALAIVLAPLFLAAQQWTPAEMMHFQRVGDADISPDGQRIAYTVSTARMDDKYSDFLSQVWVVSADGKSNLQFTFGDKSCTNPKFSPDGQFLSFTSARGDDGKNQLYLLRLAGGEAEQLTTAENGVRTYRWAPDSKRIAFTMTDTLPAAEAKARKQKQDWDVVDDYQKAQLFTVSLTKNDKGDYPIQRLTDADFHVMGYDWSPDSKTIVFAHQDAPWVDTWPSMDISTMPSDSGAIVPLVVNPGLDGSPRYSPDGKWIAYESANGDINWAQKLRVNIIPAAGGKPHTLASSPDERFDIIGWTPDGKSVLLDEPFHTTSQLYTLPVDGGIIQKVSTNTTGVFSSVSMNKKGDIGFVFQNSETPPDVYVASLGNMRGRKLTDIHAGYMEGKTVAKTEVISWKSKDGKYTIEGLLTYPHNYVAGRKYPMLLNVHGGPAGVYSQGFTGQGSVYPVQAYAQEGYFVLRANPRGSSGYGTEFRRANYRDWGYNDYDDLMGGVDKVIADGLVHPDSLVETGWSYGGYMTSMIITKTDRFKAVMAGAAVTNLMSFNGTADIPSFLPSYFGGEFWDDPEAYAKHSAMYHIKNAKTPTLIVHGMADDRVPIEQGYQLHRALQRLGVPTQMVAYPRQPHGFREPKFILDVAERTLGWFNHYLGKDGGRELKP
ncbi:MAG: S9 family peptidase [Lewinellaceae bacterium]|nr:S9 family peptidase [Saprospiraceae bacterium]MCB9331179.1 S9 family peptidase [Lewinellaceae bacterium]